VTLPASGSISLGQVATELGVGLPLSLGDSRVRTLAGVSSGPISLSNLYGKSAYTPMTLTTTNGSGGPANSETSGGTVSGQASVSVAGGSGGISIAWTVTSNANGATVGALNGSSVTASYTFVKLANGSAEVVLSVSVTDNTGHTVTATGVTIDLYWGNSV
jgi:hypothetical protein